jgi:predicted nucleic acid-binding protein
MAIFSEALVPLRKFNVDSLANVLEVAIGRHLTFCDASYAYLAETNSLRLVTADMDLLKKCSVAISISEMGKDKTSN